MVERLTGADASYLYLETPSLHMHTLKIALLDVATVPGGYSFDRLQEELAARLHLLPPFRRRLMKVPFQINHPVWVEDRDFDQAQHVQRDVVPAPGGMRQLEELIGRIASTPLSRSKPLWEIHVCEGLADGRVAVVTKMHHSIADGNAANALLANIMDELPQAAPPLAQEPWTGEPTPTKRELLVRALIDWFLQLLTAPRVLSRTVRNVSEAKRHKKTSTIPVPKPIRDTPRTSFDGALTARRTFATKVLPLEDFRKVKTAHGVSLNDVVLAVVAGSLNSWFEARGEVVNGSLTAGVPVATDGGEEGVRLMGNRVSNLFTSLHTDVADPVERLKAISVTTAEAKLVQRKLGLDLLENAYQFAPPGPFSAFNRAYSHFKAANLHASPFNVVVSNVPGPPTTLHVGGAVLDDLFSVGPILEGIGLNITVWSYQGHMSFSAITCPDNLPDLHDLVDRLGPALEELVRLS